MIGKRINENTFKIFNGIEFDIISNWDGDQIGDYIFDEHLDYFVRPYNLDTGELAVWSTFDCNIDCSYCHYKLFKSKLYDGIIDNEFYPEKRAQYVRATKPDIIEFIGGEHSLEVDRVISLDHECQRQGAPARLRIELDTNGTLIDNLEKILSNTKHVKAIISYESSDSEYNNRGLRTIDLYNNIIYLNSKYPNRIEIRYLFFNQSQTTKNDLESFKLNGVKIKEAYQIFDVNKRLGKQDISDALDGELGDLYYQAVASDEQEIFGYGRSCLDNLVREGWVRKLQSCYLLSVVNEDDRPIEDNGKIDISIMESQRRYQYKMMNKNPNAMLSGGCAIMDSAFKLKNDSESKMFDNYQLIKILRAKRIFRIYDTPEKEIQLTNFKKKLLDFYTNIDYNVPIVENPTALVHVFVGGNIPSTVTIQRYFSFLGIEVGKVSLATTPRAFNINDFEIWHQDGVEVFVDSIFNLGKYKAGDMLALFIEGKAQFILMGEFTNIISQLTTGFDKTSPSIYRGALQQHVSLENK